MVDLQSSFNKKRYILYEKILRLFEEQFYKYDEFLFGLFIGYVLFILYDKLLGKRKIVESYERIIESKDEIIKAKNLIIHGKLEPIQVEKKDKRFFNNLKKLFKGTK